MVIWLLIIITGKGYTLPSASNSNYTPCDKDYASPPAASDANYIPPFITGDKGYTSPPAASNASCTFTSATSNASYAF